MAAFLKSLICYLMLMTFVDALFLSSLGYAQLVSPVSLDVSSQVFWFLLSAAQKIGWIYIFLCLLRRTKFAQSGARGIRIVGAIILGSLVFDVLKVTYFSGYTNAPVDWDILILKAQSASPDLATAVDSYAKYSSIFSKISEIVNPIPFGVASVLWVLAISKIREDRQL